MNKLMCFKTVDTSNFYKWLNPCHLAEKSSQSLVVLEKSVYTRLHSGEFDDNVYEGNAFTCFASSRSPTTVFAIGLSFVKRREQ